MTYAIADRHSPTVVLHSDTARRSRPLGAPVHLKLLTQAHSRVMRVVHAVQTHLIRSALVVAEFQTFPVLKRQAHTLTERPRVTVTTTDGNGRAVEAHPARDPLAGQIGRTGRRAVKPR